MANTTQQPPAVLEGYPGLAEHLGKHPDFASFRRFGALGARNLLYYQAELLELEENLRDIELRDKTDCLNNRTGDRAATWYWLGGKGRRDLGNEDQYNLVCRLRVLLQQYSSYSPPDIISQLIHHKR